MADLPSVHCELLGSSLPGSLPNYRGTYRTRPVYECSQPEGAPANQAFLEYCDLSYDWQLSEAKARELLGPLQGAGQRLEVVRIEIAREPIRVESGRSLGYDLSIAGNFSFLSWGLRWEETKHGALLALMTAHFGPLLNEFCLMPRWEDADFLRRAMLHYSTLVPGCFEADEGMAKLQVLHLSIP